MTDAQQATITDIACRIEEALKDGARMILEREYQSDYIPCDDALAAWRSRAHSPAAVTVKPLEWYDSPDDDTDFCADALGLTYVVSCDLDGFCSWGFFRHVGSEEGDETWGIKDAKAAAQADYERRILSAITPGQPATEGTDAAQQAARVLLDEVKQIDHPAIPHMSRADCCDGPTVYGDYLAMFRAALRALEGGE